MDIDSLAFVLKETEASVIVCSQDVMKKLVQLGGGSLPFLKAIIVMDMYSSSDIEARRYPCVYIFILICTLNTYVYIIILICIHYYVLFCCIPLVSRKSIALRSIKVLRDCRKRRETSHFIEEYSVCPRLDK